MLASMQLTDIQKDRVRQWAAEGASLSRIQDLLAEEFNIRMSFIDVRFLVLDLEVSIKEKEKKKEQEGSTETRNSGVRNEAAPTSDLPSAGGDVGREDDSSAGGEWDEEGGQEEGMGDDTPTTPSKVSVSLSRIAQPGFAVCGDVTFSDGVQAQWGITSRGELALVGPPPNYRPSPEDARAFQTQLRNLLS